MAPTRLLGRLSTNDVNGEVPDFLIPDAKRVFEKSTSVLKKR
jgi:hypothetical protein